LITLPASCFAAGDALGRLHWLEIVDLKHEAFRPSFDSQFKIEL
jgi:hypothetical protein